MRRFSMSILAAVVLTSAAAQDMVTQAGAMIPSVPAEYRLQPGDELQIQALDIAELSAHVKIRPDGKISLLLLNEVVAAGRTVAELREYLTESYARHYRNPRIGVIVKSFENRTVYVTGEVAHPGAIPLVAGLTAVQAIVKAGGLSATSKVEDAVVIRQLDNNAPRTLRLRISDVLQNGETDLKLQPGDVIYVPKSDIKVYVGGEVTKPGMVPIDGRLTAMAAVMYAGGFTNGASPKNAFLMRDTGDHKASIIKLRLDDVMKGGSDTVLKPFDVVFVPKSGIAKVDRAMDQYVRGLLPVMLTGGFSYIFGNTFPH